MVHRLRFFFELGVICICVISLVGMVLGVLSRNLAPRDIGRHDFVEYWAAGRLALDHRDPYDDANVRSIEVPAHFPSYLPTLVMSNPPWILPFTAGLAELPMFPAQLAWLTLSLISLLWSVRRITRMCRESTTASEVLGYTFAPVLVCLMAGQVTNFLLVGLAAFFWFHRKRPFLAGMALFLCLLKPHLFLPAGCVLLLWALSRKQYRLLAGAASASLLASLTAILLDPHVWQHYIGMMRTQRPDQFQIPCLSMALRQAFGSHVPFIQWLPAAIGCAWAIWFYLRHADHWDWFEHGSLLLLVSLVVAPYTWLMDQTIAIPAVLRAASLTRSRLAIACVALGSAALEITALSQKPLLHGSISGWISVFWLAWYLVTTRQQTIGDEVRPSQSVEAAATV